ncbi:interleukin-6 receptor subunit beta-like isoform X1 [Arapaima gigas]
MLGTCRCITHLSLVLGVCVATALMPPIPAPSLLDCVFLENSTATCWWDGVDQAPPNTTYTLQVDEMLQLNGVRFQSRTCSTAGSSCSVFILTATANYCVSVAAHGNGWEVRSANRCLHGLEAVKLNPPVFHRLTPVQGHPHCLELQWAIPSAFALSPQEITKGHLQYQLRYQSDREPYPHIKERDLRCVRNIPNSAQSRESVPCLLCLFSPFTEYSVSIRYRYYRSPHWSNWSRVQQACTEEAAPSEAPQLWKWVEPTGWERQRMVTLLWKPLPPFLANGNILGYSVSCWCGVSLGGTHLWDCGILLPSNTSCRLVLPLERCSCSLTTRTAAGPSPTRRVALPAPDNPAPEALSVLPQDDITLQVRWTAPRNWTAAGYVVEWVEVTGAGPPRPSWQMVDRDAQNAIITEGVQAEVRYLVSVRALYWARSEVEPGEAVAVEAYSRQGAPSAGPRFWVTEVGTGSVLLCWEPMPVEQQHGFIRNYTLYCLGPDGQDTCEYRLASLWGGLQTPCVRKVNGTYTGHVTQQPFLLLDTFSVIMFVAGVVLPADARSHSFSDLRGVYTFYLVSSTDAGSSSSQQITVDVERDHIPLVTVLSCVILPILTALMLVAFLWHRERVVQLLCPAVPDPAFSSLSVWTPRMPCWVMKDADKTSAELVGCSENDHSCPLLVIPLTEHGHSNPAVYTVPGCADPGSEDTCYLSVSSPTAGNPVQEDGQSECSQSPSQANELGFGGGRKAWTRLGTVLKIQS